jgi:hypothetical protein
MKMHKRKGLADEAYGLVRAVARACADEMWVMWCRDPRIRLLAPEEVLWLLSQCRREFRTAYLSELRSSRGDVPRDSVRRYVAQVRAAAKFGEDG